MNPENQSDLSGQDPSGPGFGLDDAYYTFFRRKWLLLAFLSLGVVAAVAIWFVRPPRYESKAKLMVQYVVGTKVNQDGPEVINQIDSGSEAIIKSEVEILTSLDVAADVVDTVGAAKILAKKGGGDDRMSAAGVVLDGIEVAPPRTAVITITFRHPDKEVVQPVLRALIDRYMIQHRKVHRRGGEDETMLANEREQLRTKLAATEEELKHNLIKVDGLSVPEAKKVYSAQIELIRGLLLQAQAELAESKAVVGEVPQAAVTKTNSSLAAVPVEKANEYSMMASELTQLKIREAGFLGQGFTLQHPSVTNIQSQIKKLVGQKILLEKEFPALASLSVNAGTNLAGIDISAEISRIKRLTARVNMYNQQLGEIRDAATNVITLEPVIARLQRDREQYDKELQNAQAALEQSRMTTANGGKGSNISIVDHPTPPGLDKKKALKLVGMAFAGCLGMGLALAFLLDFVIDRTIKRSVEVGRHLHLPLLISIPDTHWSGRLRLSGRRHHHRSGRRHSSESSSQNGSAVVRWDSRMSIQLYANGLRERLITHFEGNGSNHGQPRRIALTSCAHGAGVTTIANSLAAALSKIPDIKVLLVDMNIGHGVARTFRNGEVCTTNATAPSDMPFPDLDVEASNAVETNSDADAVEALTVVPMRNGDNGHSAKGLPTGLAHLAPQFEANDHDFVIFDLPPASPTSMTPRLAGYMDIVLLVLESEKTGRQTAKHASELMKNSRANVAAVLNKYRKYVPERLSPEF